MLLEFNSMGVLEKGVNNFVDSLFTFQKKNPPVPVGSSLFTIKSYEKDLPIP